jgi:hypothetical protein
MLTPYQKVSCRIANMTRYPTALLCTSLAVLGSFCTSMAPRIHTLKFQDSGFSKAYPCGVYPTSCNARDSADKQLQNSRGYIGNHRPNYHFDCHLAYKMLNARQHAGSKGDREGGSLNQQLQTSQRSLLAYRRGRSRCFSISHLLARGCHLANVIPLAVGPTSGTTGLPHPHSKPMIL